MSPLLRELIVELGQVRPEDDAGYYAHLSALVTTQLRRQRQHVRHLPWPQDARLQLAGARRCTTSPVMRAAWTSGHGCWARRRARWRGISTRETGMSPALVAHAAAPAARDQWLAQGRSPTVIAHELGYASASAFNYMFGSRWAWSPLQWRRAATGLSCRGRSSRQVPARPGGGGETPARRRNGSGAFGQYVNQAVHIAGAVVAHPIDEKDGVPLTPLRTPLMKSRSIAVIECAVVGGLQQRGHSKLLARRPAGRARSSILALVQQVMRFPEFTPASAAAASAKRAAGSAFGDGLSKWGSCGTQSASGRPMPCCTALSMG